MTGVHIRQRYAPRKPQRSAEDMAQQKYELETKLKLAAAAMRTSEEDLLDRMRRAGWRESWKVNRGWFEGATVPRGKSIERLDGLFSLFFGHQYDWVRCDLKAFLEKSHRSVVIFRYGFGDTIPFRAPSEAEETLPEQPSRHWKPRPRGRPKAGQDAARELFQFIREVYGPYFKRHRKTLRGYIWDKDRPLYRAIEVLERSGRKLPRAIAMPSERQISDDRLEKLRRGKPLKKPERAALRKRSWREEKLEP
jgi:hypothetical protein